MGESAKAVLGLLLLIAAIAGVAVWTTADQRTPSAAMWGWRIGLPLAAVAIGLVLYRAQNRPDIEPDFLREFLGTPFERDGLCYCIVPGQFDGIAYLNIVFQNQYASPCEARVAVRGAQRSFLLTRAIEGVDVEFRCEGGAFGILRLPLAIPAKHQGKKAALEVAGSTRYPNGRGQLLRFRNGLRVGKLAGGSAASLGLLAIGHLHAHRPASVTLTLPANVAEQLPPDLDDAIQHLWRPGEPSGQLRRKLDEAMRPAWHL